MFINIRISKKLKFSIKEDKMQHIGNVTKVLEDLKKKLLAEKAAKSDDTYTVLENSLFSDFYDKN